MKESTIALHQLIVSAFEALQNRNTPVFMMVDVVDNFVAVIEDHLPPMVNQIAINTRQITIMTPFTLTNEGKEVSWTKVTLCNVREIIVAWDMATVLDQINFVE